MARVARIAMPHHGAVEALGLVALYGVYELTRGLVDGSWAVAYRNAAAIVELEDRLGLFVEADVQRIAHALPGLPPILGVAYMTLHAGATIAALFWVHRRHREWFAVVRTALVASSAIALVVYVFYPTAPPRLAGLGIADTVTLHTGLKLNSELLGNLYNPIAAVPSLHFGYALLVGAAVAALARRRSVRMLGALYPLVMLFVIVATGNHFWVDAVAGGLVTVAGWIVARRLLLVSATA
jgi:hypothetical protein